MTEFLQSYGQWIFLGIMVLLMLRMHRSHGSGGHGGMQHRDHHEAGVDEKDKERRSGGGCH